MTVNEAIKKLHELRCSGDMPYHFRIVIEDVINVLLRDTQEVRHGHWIEAKYPLFTCSECGATYQDTGYGYNYCPNCGADMREVEDDT